MNMRDFADDLVRTMARAQARSAPPLVADITLPTLGEVEVEYRITRAYPGSDTTPEEPAGYELRRVLWRGRCDVRDVLTLEESAAIVDCLRIEHG